MRPVSPDQTESCAARASVHAAAAACVLAPTKYRTFGEVASCSRQDAWLSTSNLHRAVQATEELTQSAGLSNNARLGADTHMDASDLAMGMTAADAAMATGGAGSDEASEKSGAMSISSYTSVSVMSESTTVFTNVGCGAALTNVERLLTAALACRCNAFFAQSNLLLLRSV
jgi:hypothetical protein